MSHLDVVTSPRTLTSLSWRRAQPRAAALGGKSNDLIASSRPRALKLCFSCSAQDKRHSSEADINRLTDDILAGIATYANDKNLTSIDLPDVEQRFSTVSSAPLVPCWPSVKCEANELGRVICLDRGVDPQHHRLP